MLGSVLVGLIAAVVVAGLRFGQENAPASPVWILGVAFVAVLIQRFLLDRRPMGRGYDGLADLFVHIHAPVTADSPVRWIARSVISFGLSIFGAAVGPEGAAVELSHGLTMRARSRSSRWFEQKRRTDAASSLAAGVAAAFGAPFAGVLFPIELGVGGRAISSAMASITAFLSTRLIMSLASVTPLDLSGALYGFNFYDLKEWGATLLIGVACGLVSVAVIRFSKYIHNGFSDLFQAHAWMKTMTAGILLFLIALIQKSGHPSSSQFLELVLWSKKSIGEVGFLFFMQLLSLTFVLGGFGTVGILWPLFALGAYVGYAGDWTFMREISGYTAAAGLAGGAAFWGAILGTPLTGALVAFEMTQNIHVLCPCLIAALVARETRRALNTKPLVDEDLVGRGMALIEGRAARVLDSILVKEAMVTDQETVGEEEPVSEIYSKLQRSRYPFFPVIGGNGAFKGLLTVDMVQDAWRAHGQETSNSPLSKLLEAKDLLYRAGFKTPTVRVNDRLSVTAGLFDDIPCVPVLSDDGRVQGLLFVYNVRLAYDREVTRRSLNLETNETART